MKKTSFVIAALLSLPLAFFTAAKAEKPPSGGAKTHAKPGTKPESKPSDSVKIICEWIEIEHADFTDYLLENELADDATPFRREIQDWVKKDRASVIRTVFINARSQQRAQVESIEEHIYSTEYDPPGIPNLSKISLRDIELDVPITPPTPSAFETRNVGVTVEVDPRISEDGKTIDLNLSPEIVSRLEDTVYHEDIDELFHIRMPLFYTAKFTTQVTVPNHGYVFAATLTLPEPHNADREDPIVLFFVRADAG